ncbi:NAD(P)-dependent oxidoreductase [Glaciihabitans arcticus]|uniref:NAD(P)-dependent oxidoreductase n=1 Tax=Glaciihabitans arcticus TaxID=2668039 RepID=A0A4Q9GYN6_9MICO|nr:NAD(P)-dependent oxidoreductase [Glaciihabitans arcticus]TBN57903.1 NAD(P)-dependent oxidoreductase [Glaciihabitans arcticus]
MRGRSISVVSAEKRKVIVRANRPGRNGARGQSGVAGLSCHDNPMERIGIIGLGRMGGPITARLTAAGFAVASYDSRPDSGRTMDDAQALAASVDILVTVLPGTPELRAVMAEITMTPGTLWLDLTSADPRAAIEIASALAEHGVASVGAPMGGGPGAAAAGELTFFVGGAETSRDRIAPVLGVLGTSTIMGDDVTAGYTTKLLANTLWFGQAIAVAEALLLGQAQGIEPGPLREALAGSAGGSAFITQHLPALFDGDYLATFGIDRVVEELDSVTALAREHGTPIELTDLVARTHREALDEFGPIDGELLGMKLLEQRAGRELR